MKRFRAALDEIYGPRLTRVVLFGSRARGDARSDSDYDVAIFLRPLGDRWQELDRLAALRPKFLDEADAFIDAVPYDARAYRERSPIMHDIRVKGWIFETRDGPLSCEGGEGIAEVSPERAKDAITTAHQFVACIAGLLLHGI